MQRLTYGKEKCFLRLIDPGIFLRQGVEKLDLKRLFKNTQMQGAQEPRNEAYTEVCRLTRLAP
jgi:hypothetical protein